MTRHKPPKILVVDDDARLRDLLRRYLGDNGYAVFVADSAQTMNRLWQRERYDLLILDLMMPGEDGLSIMRRLRGGNDQTPIIMLTAKGEEGRCSRCHSRSRAADCSRASPRCCAVAAPTMHRVRRPVKASQ